MLLFLLTVPSPAQTTGSIGGTTLDSTQAVLAGVRTVLVNTGTGESRQTLTSGDGHFLFTDLVAGRYRIRLSASGFKEVLIDNVELAVGQQINLHPVLEVGAVTESIEVTGTPPPVSTTSSSVSHVVDSQKIDRLPLNGRNALQLVALVPGVVSVGKLGQFGAMQESFQVSGGRRTEVNFLLDGGTNVNTFYNIANEYPNPDALQEFSVNLRGYSAVFGRGVNNVTAVTKSGTNSFHGSAFEFLRNTVLDARPFFAARRSPYKRNQYGGTLGGPIVRNRLFFFGGYQGTKERGSPGEVRYRTLTAAERNGQFAATIRDPDAANAPFPGNQIPANRIQPYASRFISQYLPAPNSGPDFFTFAPAQKLDQNQVIAKADYAITNNDRLSFRYLYNDIPQVGPGTIDNSWAVILPTRSQNWNLGYSRVFSPNLVTDLRLTYVRNTFGVRTEQDFSLRALGLDVDDSNAVTDFGLSSHARITVAGFFTANPAIPTRDIVPTTHLNSTTSWIAGRHAFQFGLELYRNRVNQIQNWHTGGGLTFNGFATGNAAADYLLGQYNQYRQISPLVTRLRQTLPSLFVQDDFRISRTFTLNLGLRWDPFRAWVSENDVLSAFSPGAQSTIYPKMGPGLLYPGDSGLPRSIIGNRYNNFAPRAGLAWDVKGDGRTSIRAGAGLFYMPMTRGIQFNRFPLIQPFALDAQINGGRTDALWAAAPYSGRNPFPRPDVSDQAGLQSLDFLPTAGHTAFALPYKTQTSLQWNFSIQQAIWRDAVIEIGYIGSSSSHLYSSGERNWAVYVPGQSTVANTQARRLYPHIGPLQDQRANLSANYNSFQLTFTKRYSQGFSILSAYTWAKGLGVLGGFTEGAANQRNPYNQDLDYSRVQGDIRHNWVTSFNWESPFRNDSNPWLRRLLGGWQFNGINSLRTGFPFTIRSGRDNSFTGINQDTADQTGEWRLSGDRSRGEIAARYFDTSAFAQNPVGTFGSLGINSLEGPGFWNFDLGITRTFSISESRRFEVRAISYNLVNWVNLGSPAGVQGAQGTLDLQLTSPTFGRITTTQGDARIIEFGLRFVF